MRQVLTFTDAELAELEHSLNSRCRWYETRCMDPPANAVSAYQKVRAACVDAGLIGSEDES